MTDSGEMPPNHPYRPASSSELSCSATTPGPRVPAPSALAHAAKFRISPSLALRLVEPTSGVPDHTAARPVNAALSRAAIVPSRSSAYGCASGPSASDGTTNTVYAEKSAVARSTVPWVPSYPASAPPGNLVASAARAATIAVHPVASIPTGQ